MVRPQGERKTRRLYKHADLLQADIEFGQPLFSLSEEVIYHLRDRGDDAARLPLP